MGRRRGRGAVRVRTDRARAVGQPPGGRRSRIRAGDRPPAGEERGPQRPLGAAARVPARSRRPARRGRGAQGSPDQGRPGAHQPLCHRRRARSREPRRARCRFARPGPQAVQPGRRAGARFARRAHLRRPRRARGRSHLGAGGRERDDRRRARGDLRPAREPRVPCQHRKRDLRRGARRRRGVRAAALPSLRAVLRARRLPPVPDGSQEMADGGARRCPHRRAAPPAARGRSRLLRHPHRLRALRDHGGGGRLAGLARLRRGGSDRGCRPGSPGGVRRSRLGRISGRARGRHSAADCAARGPPLAREAGDAGRFRPRPQGKTRRGSRGSRGAVREGNRGRAAGHVESRPRRAAQRSRQRLFPRS